MEVNEWFERDRKKKQGIMERLAENANSRAFKVLFEYLDMEIDNCRDGLEEKDSDILRGAILSYRELKKTIINAKEISKAINADTPE